MPKQFISLLGQRSCFQEAMLRVSGELFSRPIVVTGSDCRFLVRQQVNGFGCEEAILLEPEGRNSGPAILAAVHKIMAKDPNSILMVLAADRVIGDPEAFVDAVMASVSSAQSGKIVTSGVTPDRPACVYGYIQPGAAMDDRVQLVEVFVEKPDTATAHQCVSADYLWNSENFMF